MREERRRKIEARRNEESKQFEAQLIHNKWHIRSQSQERREGNIFEWKRNFRYTLYE
jgi:hypothetical protein